MTYKNLTITQSDPGVFWVTLQRPESLNALNTETLKELLVALHELEKKSEARVVVLTGAGEKAFVAGADIVEMKGMTTTEAATFSRLGHEVARCLSLMEKPTIAAVNGFALGGGTELAIACDMILASENAVFGQPEVGIGVIPGFGGTIRLLKFIGLPRAKEMIFSGRKVRAAEALAWGLVNRVVPLAQLKDEVNALARQIGANSMDAVGKAKRLINEFSEASGLNGKIDAEVQEFALLFGSRDQVEGMKAFTEKRSPQFEGINP